MCSNHSLTPNLALRRNPTGFCSGGGSYMIIITGPTVRCWVVGLGGSIKPTQVLVLVSDWWTGWPTWTRFIKEETCSCKHCSSHILDCAPGTSTVLLCSRADRTHVFLMTDATTDHGTKKAEWSLQLFCSSKQKYYTLPHRITLAAFKSKIGIGTCDIVRVFTWYHIDTRFVSIAHPYWVLQPTVFVLVSQGDVDCGDQKV